MGHTSLHSPLAVYDMLLLHTRTNNQWCQIFYFWPIWWVWNISLFFHLYFPWSIARLSTFSSIYQPYIDVFCRMWVKLSFSLLCTFFKSERYHRTTLNSFSPQHPWVLSFCLVCSPPFCLGTLNLAQSAESSNGIPAQLISRWASTPYLLRWGQQPTWMAAFL